MKEGKKESKIYQYAIHTLTEKIKNEKKIKEEKEQEQKSIETKLNQIRTYNNLKEKIKIHKTEIGLVGVVMLLVACLFPILVMPEGLYLIGFYEIMCGCFALGKIRKLRNCKKAIKINVFKGINELIENQESMEELSENLEKEIENREAVINEYEVELEKVSLLDEFQNKELYNQPFYQANTEEEYELLRRRQDKEMMPFEEFLNEPVDYGNIHLEVSEMDQSKKVFVKRK